MCLRTIKKLTQEFNKYYKFLTYFIYYQKYIQKSAGIMENQDFMKTMQAEHKRLLNESPDENKKENVNEQNKKILENGELGTDWEDVTYKELDGKIGPKEPVYCFCNYISYGNMIKCDNPLCKREWFHFHCVGLRNQPKGKWFCSEKCAKEYLKKNKSERNFEKNKTKSKKKKKIK